MHRLLLAFCLTVPGLTAGAAPAEHVILISIDGLRPDFYLEPERPMPLLRHMAREGVRALAVEPVFPSVTYPAHTTMVTGVRPARHGVHYNAPFESGGYSGRWYWEFEHIRAPTLWQAIRAAGGTTAAVSWPVTVGAPIDLNLPEVWSLEPETRFGDRLRETAMPPGLLVELEETVGVLTEANYTLDYFARDIVATELAIELLERKPTLLALHLVGVDHFQHVDGREALSVERALATVDTALGMLLESVERLGIAERTAWVITGDHGFVDTHTTLYPNVWLTEAGIAADRSDEDWEAAFLTTGAAGFLHLRDPDDTATLGRVEAALDDLPGRVRALFRVVDRDGLSALGAAPEAALGLSPANGINLSGRLGGPALRGARGGTHGYLPDTPGIATGFVGYGAGFARDRRIPVMQAVDVYPILTHLLDLDPGDVEGVLLPGVFASGR